MASSQADDGFQDLPGRGGNPVRRAINWWLGALFESLPVPLQLCLGAHQAVLRLDHAGRRVSLYRRGGNLWIPLLETRSEANDPGFREKLLNYLRKNGYEGAEVDLRLESRHFMRRVVELPSTALENLHEVLGFEMDRYTPLDAAAVYYDFRLLEHDPQRKRIRVDLVVLPRNLADDAIGYGRALGLKPLRLGIAGTDNTADSGFNLLPPALARKSGRLWSYVVFGLFAALLALGALALYLPLHHKQAALDRLEERVTLARGEAQAVAELKRKTDALRAREDMLRGALKQRIAATELLEEISLRLPDDTWIERMVLRNREVMLAGYSPSPSALIGLLGDSPILSNVAFRGAVKPDPRLKLDSFRISADVGLPEPQP